MNRNNSSIVAKAGIWYTICNILFRGMAFITTPIFARMMSKTDLGSFSNFSSWATILLVVTSFDLSQSIIRSKLEHENDMDCYIWSILCFSTIWTILLYAIMCICMPFFSALFSMEEKYIHILFLYLLVSPAYMMFITKHRAFYKYKMFSVLTGTMTLSGTLLSLFFVTVMQDRLEGRILGYYVPQIILGFVIFIVIIVKGKRIKIEYWRYACVIMLPLVPHVLSLYLLSSSDKIIITRLCGAEYTAIYSIAYSAYHIGVIIFDSMNKAWAPWLIEALDTRNYDAIKSTSKKYISTFIILILGILMLVPEVILILGGRNYVTAIYCLPPLIASCVFQFIYTMYVNIEFYEKKTLGASLATMIATAINIILNYIFIPMEPEYCYIIAAYTTLVGYIVLFILHYFIVKRLRKSFIYDIKFIIGILVLVLVISGVMNFLYKFAVIRYILFLVYMSFIMYIVYRHKNEVFNIFRKQSKN